MVSDSVCFSLALYENFGAWHDFNAGYDFLEFINFST